MRRAWGTRVDGSVTRFNTFVLFSTCSVLSFPWTDSILAFFSTLRFSRSFRLILFSDTRYDTFLRHGCITRRWHHRHLDILFFYGHDNSIGGAVSGFGFPRVGIIIGSGSI